MTGPRSHSQLVANLGLEAMASNSQGNGRALFSRDSLCLTGMGLCPRRPGVERKDRVKVRISFNPLIWLKPKPRKPPRLV